MNKSNEIVVYCHVGNRSTAAVELLSALGFKKVRNLTGGLKAWEEQVDPEFPTY